MKKRHNSIPGSAKILGMVTQSRQIDMAGNIDAIMRDYQQNNSRRTE